ncbi:MAG: phosphopentomutase [Legionellales bacterium]|nr:phosphopentomutase [Legionellales bacterium]|tara:strand:- start:157 stop:1374 length:1218 start_codon:yes stop_codon:yes gene_type:complete
MIKRAIVLLFDSFGLGSSADASPQDQGADTFGHIAEWCASGRANKSGLRRGPLHIPNLSRLGLIAAGDLSRGKSLPFLQYAGEISGRYGYAIEQSHGKDTPSGHWEIAGVPVLFDWGYFPDKEPCFPDALVEALIREAQLPGILGNKHASGTVIIEELGEEHIQSGKPIVYTSADSVLQIAAHEDSFGLERLYELCNIARQLVDEYHIGRVIARPFVGETGQFTRSNNRRDYSTPPPAPTLFDELIEQDGEVIAIGKTADIFAHRGISQTIKAYGNDDLFTATLDALQQAGDKSLLFTNFVDFDMLYGHRRDVIGYANGLETLDQRLPELEAQLQPGDIVIITADHGCDPTWPGSDHTREHIPVLAFGPGITPSCIGGRDSFADIGQSIASHLGIKPLAHGKNFL